MTSFATITPEEYKKLVDNERKIFDLTKNFTNPEILNKYRHTDKNIEDKIKQEEMSKEKYENLDKIINKSIDRHKTKPIIDFTVNYVNDSVLDRTDYDNSEIYKLNYRFNNDDEILNSFSKIFKEYDIKCNPRQDTRYYRVRYLLNELKGSENIPVGLYNHFNTTLLENNKAYRIIPIEKNDQTGSSVNNIIINDKDLNNGILRIRYLNNRKLTNTLLKHDYKISKKW